MLTYEEILDIEFENMRRDKITIRDYLKELLVTLWEEGESFSGKRPFGDSGWEYEIFGALVDNKVIHGTNEDYCLDLDEDEALKLVIKLINYVFERKQ